MNKLFAGFSRVNVTPMVEIGMPGYFKPRFAEGVLDELEINALALSCGEEEAVLLSIDHEGITREIAADYRNHISEVTGVHREAIYLHATHIHTGPFLNKNSENELEQEYYRAVYRKMADAAQFALEDLKPAKMGWAVSQAPRITFSRRFRMKDGSVRTNPGVNNPDILEPIGEMDESVNVLRFDREGAESLVLVNYGNHADAVGGCRISADYPGFLRRTLEKTLSDAKCIFFNGAE
ncbi:MAG: hypothetical protein LBQ48_02885, partial [Oscillospiraceae bacterium]|nr:hypothetical protein [Oscillospiraceae bacterium]